MPPTNDGAPAPEPAAREAATAPRPRSRRRRLAVAAAWFVGVAALLVAAAPTIATSRPVLSRVETRAAAIIGRPVELRDVAVGWITTVSVGAIVLPPVAGEPKDRPMLRVEGVDAPVTLIGLLRAGGAPETVALRARHVEANIIRRGDGSLNVLVAKGALEASTASTQTQSTPAGPKVTPSPLPIRSASVAVEKFDLRFIDQARPEALESGIEGARLDASMPGWGRPVTATIAGTVVSGRERRPFSVALSADRIVRSDGIIDAASPKADVRVDLDGAAQPLLAGKVDVASGGRLDADVAADMQLGPLLALAAPHLESPPPAVLGGIRARLTAKGDPSAKLFATLTVASSSLSTPRDGARVPLPDINAEAALELDGDARRIDSATARVRAPGLDIDAATSAMPYSGPASDTALTLRAAAELAALHEAFRPLLDARATPPEGPPPIDGRLALKVEKSTSAPPGAWAAGISAGWSGGRIDTAALPGTASGTGRVFDLRETACTIEGEIAYEPASRQFSTSGIVARFPAFGDVSIVANGTTDAPPMREFNVVANTDLRLGDLRRAFAPLMPPTVGDIAGNLSGRLQLSQKMAQPIEGSLTVESPALTVGMTSPEAVLLDAEPVVIDIRADASPDFQSARLLTSSVRLPFAMLSAEGRWRAGEATTAHVGLDMPLAPALALARRVRPIDEPAAAEGVLAATVDATIQPDGRATARIEASLRNASATLASGDVVELPLSIGLRVGSARATGLPILATITDGTISFGPALDARIAGMADLDSERPILEIDASAKSGHVALLGAVPPSIIERLPVRLSIDGDTSATISVRGTTPAAPMKLVATTISRAGELGWVSEAGEGTIEGATIEASVQATVDPASPAATSGNAAMSVMAASISVPGGTTMSGLAADARARFAGRALEEATGSVSLASLATVRDAFAVSLPATQASFSIAMDGESGAPEYRGSSEARIEGIANARADGAYRASPFWWTASGRLDAPDAAALAAIYKPTFEAADLPRVGGSASLGFDLRSDKPLREAIGLGLIPATGNASVRLASLSFAADDGTAVEGGAMSGTLAVSPREARLMLDGAATSVRGSGPAAPLRDVSMRGEAALRDLGTLQVRDLALAVGSLDTQVSGTLAVEGLRLPLVQMLEQRLDGAEPVLPTLRQWLDTISVDADLGLRSDLARTGSFAPDLALSGIALARMQARSRPGGQARATISFDAADISAGPRVPWRVEGMGGGATLSRSIRLVPNAPTPSSPPPRMVTFRSISFDKAPYSGSIGGFELSLKGADGGVFFDGTSPEFLGGPAAIRGSLLLSRGSPLIDAELQSTSLDIRRILPPPGSQFPAPLPTNSITRLRWHLTPASVGSANPLEGLDLRVDITRIDRTALVKMLEAMDPGGVIDSIQKGVLALQFGGPRNATMRLANGLFSFDVLIEPRAGLPAIPMPLLRRVPIADLVRVYDLKSLGEKLRVTRFGLVMLLADQLETIEAELAARRQEEGR